MHIRAYSRVVWLTILAFFAMTAPAAATFHFWYINEIYSNADGSIQFIEFFTTKDKQERLIGEILTSSLDAYLFEVDLPDDLTANLFFLVGTESYVVEPGAVAPDYTVPDNFFSVDGDTIDFASVDAVTFGMGDLPIDGLFSIDWNLVTSPNSPTNFAGQNGQVDPVPEPALSVGLVAGVACLAILARRRRAIRFRSACVKADLPENT